MDAQKEVFGRNNKKVEKQIKSLTELIAEQTKFINSLIILISKVADRTKREAMLNRVNELQGQINKLENALKGVTHGPVKVDLDNDPSTPDDVLDYDAILKLIEENRAAMKIIADDPILIVPVDPSK